MQSERACWLGIDLGTSSVKCALVDCDTLEIVGIARRDYVVNHPQVGYAEQATEDWWQATVETVRELITAGGRKVVGIGYSGQMHGTVLLDSDNAVLHPAIIWADQRSADVLETMQTTVGKTTLVQQTGTAPAAGFMLSTLAWLKENDPALLENVKTVLLPKDYIRYRMTGVLATDVSDAAGTGIFDIRQRTWATGIADVLGIPSALFPSVVSAYDVVGKLMQEAAEAMNLSEGIPVVAGCADQPAQAIGNGIWGAGRASITLGSGGQVFLPIPPDADSWTTDERLHVFNHAADGWYVLGAMLSAGLSLIWFRDVLDITDFNQLTNEVASLSAGSEGLLFLTYLNGERTPHMNPQARATFFGLTARHTRYHMAQAIMEGVGFALRQIVDLSLSVSGADVPLFIGAGGGMVNPTWRQIVVDILGRPIAVSTRTEAAAF
ncbi:MAG: xylulokinase, partial [Chloroflexota bacterium]